VAGWFGSAVFWEAARVFGGSGRASPAPTGDEVACSVGIVGSALAAWVSAVIGEGESSWGPSLRSLPASG
jgi:hypothetical protein